MKIVNFVKKNDKEGFKEALCKTCDDLKARSDDILCDCDKSIRSIEITLKVEYGKVSTINISKEMLVEEQGE